MKKIVNKTVNLNLVGINGNAYVIMGMFALKAKEEGWTKQEIDLVLYHAKQGDYDHLLATIECHCHVRDDDE